MELGILVVGYNRPKHLDAVLSSLKHQRQLDRVHVWIDGSQGRGEYIGANAETVRVARRYRVKEIREHRSHLGIEKLMLDALTVMGALYSSVIVLEDDCFPVDRAIETFEAELLAIKDRPDIFSVYGHFFGMEPEECREFSRFQGWGWAAHSHQVAGILPKLRELFMLDEDGYVRHIEARMTPEIRKRLDRTPGRDVLNVLAMFFSWDSAIAFLTAEAALEHRRTPQAVVKNTGITPRIGHFTEDSPRFRKPPFNMITLDEAWKFF